MIMIIVLEDFLESAKVFVSVPQPEDLNFRGVDLNGEVY